MKIYPYMINILSLPEKIQEEILDKYMEYPPNNKIVTGVIQRHEIGRSQHFDFRFPVNNHLNGWSIVGFSEDKPAKLSELVPGKGFRAEPKCEGGECNDYMFNIYEKDGEYYYTVKDENILSNLSFEDLARQPKIWLFPKWKIGERHEFKPGTVGAGCFREDVEVLTQEGMKKIKDVKKGDLVYTHKGRWRKVNYLVHNMKETRKCYEIRIKPGGTYIVTEDHPFFIAELWYNGKQLTNRIKKLSFLTAKELFEHYKNHPGHSQKLQLAIPRTIEKKKELSYIDGLIVGLILGDGYCRKQDNRIEIYFTYPDDWRLMRYYQHILEDMGIKTSVDRIKRDNTIQMSFVSKKYTDLRKILEENPMNVYNFSKEFSRGLIEGLLDSDGHRCKSYENIVQSKPLSKRIIPHAILHSDKLISHIRYERGERSFIPGSIKHVYISSDWGLKISEDGKYLLKKFSIKETETPKETYNLNVEGDQSFFIPNAITHNTEKPGYMTVLARPKVVLGSQKPYYHEYFLKDFGQYKDWVRVVIRRVKGKVLEPGTKVPTEKETLYWKFMVAKDSTPYAISKRAISKGWKPPKNIIPFPEDWVKKKFPEKYKKWLEYMGKEEKTELSKVKFTYSLVSWIGPKHIRGTPRLRWFLFIDDKNKNTVRTFRIDGSLFRSNILSAVEEERVSKKWMEYEGKVTGKWVETKKLEGHMIILDKGTVEYKTDKEDNIEVITLKFNGKKLKSKWILTQEDKDSDFYTIERTTKLSKHEFVYHKHQLEGKKPHYDLRIKINNSLWEMNLWLDIRKYRRSLGIPKVCYDTSWFIKEGKNIKKKVGRIPSTITVLDHGTIEIIENTPLFKSFKIEGKVLKGYYVLRKEDNRYYFEKSSLPGEKRLSTFTIEEKKGWDYFYIKVHDMRKYTRCTKDIKKYLDIEIPSGIEIYICFYHREGKIHGAEVGMIKFYKDKWDHDTAIAWIKKYHLDTWIGEMIRE